MKLGDEHIIPEALAGRLVLPDASCGECEKRINRFEQPLLRNDFSTVRYALSMPTKRPKSRPPAIDLEFSKNGSIHRRSIAVGQNPLFMAMFQYRVAGIFLGEEPSAEREIAANSIRTTGPYDSEASRALVEEMGQTAAISAIGNEANFPLMLAKIAHAAAYGATGGNFGHFTQVLPALIRGEKSPYAVSYLIGGMSPLHEEEPPPPSENPRLKGSHEIVVFMDDAHDTFVLCVAVRLFASFGMPYYAVVAGIAPATLRAEIIASQSISAPLTEYR